MLSFPKHQRINTGTLHRHVLFVAELFIAFQCRKIAVKILFLKGTSWVFHNAASRTLRLHIWTLALQKESRKENIPLIRLELVPAYYRLPDHGTARCMHLPSAGRAMSQLKYSSITQDSDHSIHDFSPLTVYFSKRDHTRRATHLRPQEAKEYTPCCRIVEP